METKSFKVEKNQSSYEYIFKSLESFSSAQTMFSTTIYDSTLWIDNVTFTEVECDTLGSTPLTNSPIFINKTSSPKTIKLLGSYLDLNGILASSLTIPANSSKILTKSLVKSIISNGKVDDSGAINSTEPDLDKLVVYSNPTREGDKIYIYYPDCNKLIVKYSVVDISGKELLNGLKTCDGLNQLEIESNQLEKGFYIINLSIGKQTKTVKIIITN
jgi:hypothetical protein